MVWNIYEKYTFRFLRKVITKERMTTKNGDLFYTEPIIFIFVTFGFLQIYTRCLHMSVLCIDIETTDMYRLYVPTDYEKLQTCRTITIYLPTFFLNIYFSKKKKYRTVAYEIQRTLVSFEQWKLKQLPNIYNFHILQCCNNFVLQIIIGSWRIKGKLLQFGNYTQYFSMTLQAFACCCV